MFAEPQSDKQQSTNHDEGWHRTQTSTQSLPQAGESIQLVPRLKVVQFCRNLLQVQSNSQVGLKFCYVHKFNVPMSQAGESQQQCVIRCFLETANCMSLMVYPALEILCIGNSHTCHRARNLTSLFSPSGMLLRTETTCTL